MRAIEGLAIRLKDVDLQLTQLKFISERNIQRQKLQGDIYISDEATQYFKQWLEWKYNNEERPRIRNEEDLVFTVNRSKNPHGIICQSTC